MSEEKLTVEDLARITHNVTAAFQNAKFNINCLMWKDLGQRLRASKIAEVKLHLQNKDTDLGVAYQRSVDLFLELGFLRTPHTFSDNAADDQMVAELYFSLIKRYRDQVEIPVETQRLAS